MYIIETDLGRFIGDDEKQAKRKLRAARLAAAALEAARVAEKTAAQLAADSQGYAIYHRHAGGDCPRAWRSYRAGGYGFKMAAMVDGDDYGRRLVIQTPDGTARIDYWLAELTAVIINGSGWPIAVELQHGGDNPPILAAVGYSGTTAAVVPLAIPITWFLEGGQE